ncbi:MAG: SDR family NAD(P)-dependent oxidoreductase [Acidobacteria bacterium]|nr:SDR family NAD(P)-dependent oxidoreductase [Acidobacteriota bacterium]
MNRAENRVAIITGAAGGLGGSVARLLASRGHDLSLVDIKGDALSKVASEFSCLGVRIHVIAANLEQDSECQKVVEQTLSTFGKVDILVNAAAFSLGPL